MRSLQPITLLMGLAAFAAGSGAPGHAQEFTIAEVASPAGLGVEQLKPKTIAFMDRPGEDLIDPDAGLIRFEDWAQARAVEKQFLSPFPSYLEPHVEVTVDGVRKRFKEKLHMYVGEARFALARAPGSIDLAGLVTARSRGVYETHGIKIGRESRHTANRPIHELCPRHFSADRQ